MKFKKGTKKYLKYDKNHLYIKLDNDNFGWWRLEDLSKHADKRMHVKMSDEQVLKENHFILKIK